MPEEITFEDAKAQSLKKWRSIVRRLKKIKKDVSIPCGFCKRFDQRFPEMKDTDECDNRCEAIDICYIDDLRDYLRDAIEEAELIRENVENLEVS